MHAWPSPSPLSSRSAYPAGCVARPPLGRVPLPGRGRCTLRRMTAPGFRDALSRNSVCCRGLITHCAVREVVEMARGAMRTMARTRRVWLLLLALLLVGLPYSRAQIRRKRPRIEDDLRGTLSTARTDGAAACRIRGHIYALPSPRPRFDSATNAHSTGAELPLETLTPLLPLSHRRALRADRGSVPCRVRA